MGKVYDALRRAEEQRARRVQETAGTPAPPAPEARAHDVAEEAAMETAAAPMPPAAPPASEPGRWSSLGTASGVATRASTGDLNRRRIALLQPDSYVAEQFRTLRARLDSLAATRPLRSLAITSALAGDGKSLAAIGLASVTAMQPGRRVLLIDCDLRKPTVGVSLGLRVDAGLAEVLAGSARVEDAVAQVEGTHLHVMPVRAIPQNPSELLASEAMAKLLAQVSQQYDRVVLDLPPVLGLPDAKTVSELCDGVVFVVRADVTSSAEVETALDVLDRGRILGVVMNDSDRTAGSYERA